MKVKFKQYTSKTAVAHPKDVYISARVPCGIRRSAKGHGVGRAGRRCAAAHIMQHLLHWKRMARSQTPAPYAARKRAYSKVTLSVPHPPLLRGGACSKSVLKNFDIALLRIEIYVKAMTLSLGVPAVVESSAAQ